LGQSRNEIFAGNLGSGQAMYWSMSLLLTNPEIHCQPNPNVHCSCKH
jgi:hypothetical protein